jgi:hypothetical protein
VTRVTLLAIALAAVVIPSESDAQLAPSRPRAEARLDVIAARRTATQIGVGVAVPAGIYVRAGATVAAGLTTGEGRTDASGRLDLIARFLLDPILQFPRAPYAGGGVSLRYDGDERIQSFLVIVIGVEGSPRRGILPSVELGLGGGVRAGVVLRRAVPGSR